MNLAADRGRRLQRQARALLRPARRPMCRRPRSRPWPWPRPFGPCRCTSARRSCSTTWPTCPVEEVAATLGTRTGTVKSLLARGRQALAAQLGDPEEVRSP